MAETGGFIRSFISKGSDIEALLYSLSQKSDADDYIHEILAAWEKEFPPIREQPHHKMVDSLTPKEWEVLQFLATNLSIPEIADQMVLSANTVRTHVKHIYEKLGVNRRRSAIQKAKQLHLI